MTTGAPEVAVDTPFIRGKRSFGSAVARWASVGPYYAMFPLEFAFDVIETYAPPGCLVLDPFAGRGTSVFAAAASGRSGLGFEINPVGWLYSDVKLAPAAMANVLRRLDELVAAAAAAEASQEDKLPEFFASCYAPGVLQFLRIARDRLAWRTSRVDATLMAIILVHLHGKRGFSLSNQMRDGKAMAPDYAVRWWAEHNLTPPEIDVGPFLTKRIKWRYKRGAPKFEDSRCVNDDCIRGLVRTERDVATGRLQPAKLLFTSPPYCGVTNYFYDQWLRLWMLGHPPQPGPAGNEWKRKFESKEGYQRLLRDAFTAAAKCMAEDAVVYVRTDARKFTLDTTRAVLREVFNTGHLVELLQPLQRRSQTHLFGDTSEKPGEVDLVVKLGARAVGAA